MDNILVLDTSGSMAGSSLNELKRAVLQFVTLIEKMGLGDRVAIVSFGGNTRTVCPLTDNYSFIKSCVTKLVATGSTPMAEGLLLGVTELKNARALSLSEDITLLPRIILMTDGAPDNKMEVLAVAQTLGELSFPIACVGVTGCDKVLMAAISKLTGGMFVMAEDVTLLQLFFLRQVLVIVFVLEMAKELENLMNREILREFLEEKSGQRVSEEELDGFIIFLNHIVKTEKKEKPRPTRSNQRAIEYQPNRTYNTYPQSTQTTSTSCCPCTIL
eukprot:TRINITY_DN5935_c0_g2_i1.p1 TRINITY_DN5935_c0_g2~~TRINITY_DN5935_c0_g2_i1.p1  ORF type:complete len:273 (+),score=48.01 TRINITY_DN5935_c0_g2_i1:52-870(+)